MNHAGNAPLSKSFPPLPTRPTLPLPLEDKDIQKYSWNDLKRIFEAFSERERALELRVSALCFRAEESLKALQTGNPMSEPDEEDALHEHPILGLRLLQRVDQLQRENDDLAQRIDDLLQTTSMEHIKACEQEIQGTTKAIPLTRRFA
ncbi:hypothetical protein ACI68E_001868 [Malassezia pachydermatis]